MQTIFVAPFYKQLLGLLVTLSFPFLASAPALSVEVKDPNPTAYISRLASIIPLTPGPSLSLEERLQRLAFKLVLFGNYLLADATIEAINANSLEPDTLLDERDRTFLVNALAVPENKLSFNLAIERILFLNPTMLLWAIYNNVHQSDTPFEKLSRVGQLSVVLFTLLSSSYRDLGYVVKSEDMSLLKDRQAELFGPDFDFESWAERWYRLANSPLPFRIQLLKGEVTIEVERSQAQRSMPLESPRRFHRPHLEDAIFDRLAKEDRERFLEAQMRFLASEVHQIVHPTMLRNMPPELALILPFTMQTFLDRAEKFYPGGLKALALKISPVAVFPYVNVRQLLCGDNVFKTDTE